MNICQLVDEYLSTRGRIYTQEPRDGVGAAALHRAPPHAPYAAAPPRACTPPPLPPLVLSGHAVSLTPY